MIATEINTSKLVDRRPLKPIYAPYVYSCPGKSEITFHGVKSKGINPLYEMILYDSSLVPDVSLTSRENIELKGVNKSLIAHAQKVVKVLKAEWEKGKQLKAEFETAQSVYKTAMPRFVRPNIGSLGGDTKTRYVESEEKDQLRNACDAAREACKDHPFSSPYAEKTAISKDNFLKVFNLAVDECLKIKDIPQNLKNNKSFEALVTYLSVETELNKSGFLVAMPNGFYDYTDPDLIEKIRTIGTYVLVNQLKINTAKKAEDNVCFTSKDAPRLGLQYLSNILTLEDLYKICFPGYLEGANPPIRPWKVSGSNKWQAAAPEESYKVRLLAIKAVKNVFELANVLNPDGSINIDELLKRNWGTIFHDELVGAIGNCAYTPDSLAALELAVPGIYEYIPRFKFDYPGKWMGVNALTTIDEITRNVVEENGCLKSDGTFNVEKARTIEDWVVQYNNQVSGCLGRSGVGTAYKALERVFPAQFGWGADQMHPGEIRYGGMWSGKEGKRLFQLRLACSIYETFKVLKNEWHIDFQDHTVVFNHELEYPLIMSKRDVQLFIKYLRENNKDWGAYIADHGLTAGLRDAASGSVKVALKDLFGKPKGKNQKLGNTELKAEDFLLTRNSKKRSSILDYLSSEVTVKITDSQFSINGFGKQDDYNGSESTNTGIAGTCLEKLLGKLPPSKTPEHVKVLYKAFSGAVLSYPSIDGFSVQERKTVLEKIAVSKEYPPRLEPLLSESDLQIFLQLIKKTILPNTLLSDQVKLHVSEGLDKLIELRDRTRNNRREIIVEACNTIDFDKTTVFTVLNDVCERLFNTMAIYEMRVFRTTNAYSPLFQQVHLRASSEQSFEELAAGAL